jgi:GTPase
VDESVTHEGRDYTFVDTAGIRRKGKTKLVAEKLAVMMARRHIDAADVVILMLDALEGPAAQDATIAGYAHEAGRPVVVCVNKWDAMDDKRHANFAERVRDELKFLDYAPVLFISAKTGASVARVWKAVREGYDASNQRVGTGELNRFVEFLKADTDIKLKYMTQAGVRPPTFVLFAERGAELHFSTERFLMNQLRKRFHFGGTPLVVKLKREDPRKR